MTVDKKEVLTKSKNKVAHQLGWEDFNQLNNHCNSVLNWDIVDKTAVEAYNEAINTVLKNIKLTPAQRIDVSQLIIK